MNDEDHSPPDVLLIPGGMMLRRPFPSGLPVTDSTLISQVRLAASSSTFDRLRSDVDDLFASLTHALARVEYHQQRCAEVIAELAKRRTGAPGNIVYDPLVAYVHFELFAFLGAARLIVDEVVYLALRRDGRPHNRVKQVDSAKLVNGEVEPDCQVPEVLLLRKHGDWFDVLNAYRNAAFPRGARHGSGNFDPLDVRVTSQTVALNAMYLPDKESLRGRSKPFEWTFNSKYTVEKLVAEIKSGLEAMLGELVAQVWNTHPPEAGRIPLREQQYLLVRFVRPAIAVLPGDNEVVPFFSNRALAERFAEETGTLGGLELVSIVPSAEPYQQSAALFSLAGYQQDAQRPPLHIVLNPRSPDGSWIRVEGIAHISLAQDTLTPEVLAQPLGLPLQNMEEVFAWVEPETFAVTPST